MDPLTASLIFAGGSSLIGGIGNWFSGRENRKSQQNANAANYAAQKEFYQNSVGWRVADSKRSGVNPIYGLGADSASFSPSFQAVGGSGVGDALNSVGQSGLAMSQIIAQSQMVRAQTKMYEAEAQLKQVQAQKEAATPISLPGEGVKPTLDPTVSSASPTPVKKDVDSKKIVPQEDYGSFWIPNTNKSWYADSAGVTHDGKKVLHVYLTSATAKQGMSEQKNGFFDVLGEGIKRTAGWSDIPHVFAAPDGKYYEIDLGYSYNRPYFVAIETDKVNYEPMKFEFRKKDK